MALELPTLPTVVVVDAAPAAPLGLSSLSEPENRALSAWRQGLGLATRELPDEPPLVTLPIDPERPDRLERVERALHAARGALDLADPSAAADVRARVAVAYAEVRAHPADPEAPFLAAECLRALARVEELVGDAEGAQALRVRAAAFDGGRRLGLSEGGPWEPPPVAALPFALTLLDAPAGAAALVDGERDVAALPPGEHHLRVVTTDGRPLAARWFHHDGTGLVVRLGAPRPGCTGADLGPALARLAADEQATFGVTCGAWVRVVRRAASIEVRVCSAHDCGATSRWSTVPLPLPAKPPATSALRSGWTWTAIGALVVGGTLTAWGLGAFDRERAPSPTWRWEGAK